MNFLRRELAPVTTEGWTEIDAFATQALTAVLAGRRFVDLDGPHGLAYASVPLGRLALPETQPAPQSANGGSVSWGVHQVLPLVEARIPFTLKIWELDNLERGARDPALDALTEACHTIAAFEDQAIFNGFAPAGIAGLHQSAQGAPIALKREDNAFVEAVAEARTRLRKAGIRGGANLAVSGAIWKFLAHPTAGGTLRADIERQIEGKVIYAELAHDALLLAARGGDAELTVGQDFAIGYQGHTSSEVSLFLTESFTFRVVAPEALVAFTLAA